MPVVILRLMTLLALALMPFGMSAGSAAPGHHHAPGATAAGHCNESKRPDNQSPANAADCAISCSMLLSAQASVEDPAPLVPLLPAWPPAYRQTGLHPDTATPPPKVS